MIKRRLIGILPVLLGVSLIVFVVLRLAPGDPVSMLVPDGGSQEEIERITREWGLDRSIPMQYWEFLRRAVQGDFGQSYKYAEPVSRVVLERMPATIELAVLSLLISTVVAIPIGIFSAIRHNSLWDHSFMGLALVGTSIPPFWLGIMLIILLGGDLNLLPVSGRLSYGVELKSVTGLYLVDSLLTLNGKAFVDAARHIVMPSFTLGIVMAAMAARITRSSMLDVLRQDYVRTAWAKGLRERSIVVRHALKNALIPVVTLFGLQVGVLMGGTVVLESIFSLPGLGSLALGAVRLKDYPQVQGLVLFFAAVLVTINLVVDISYAWLDPRIRFA